MAQEDPLLVFEIWFQSQRHGKAAVPKGTIAGALAVLERLKANFELDLKKHLTHRGGQIQGQMGKVSIVFWLDMVSIDILPVKVAARIGACFLPLKACYMQLLK